MDAGLLLDPKNRSDIGDVIEIREALDGHHWIYVYGQPVTYTRTLWFARLIANRYKRRYLRGLHREVVMYDLRRGHLRA